MIDPTRRARLGAIAEELRGEGSLVPFRAPKPLPRFVLVTQYADTGRGTQYALQADDVSDDLVQQAHQAVWDGWLPHQLHDLEEGTVRGVSIAFVLQDTTPGPQPDEPEGPA